MMFSLVLKSPDVKKCVKIPLSFVTLHNISYKNTIFFYIFTITTILQT